MKFMHIKKLFSGFFFIRNHSFFATFIFILILVFLFFSFAGFRRFYNFQTLPLLMSWQTQENNEILMICVINKTVYIGTHVAGNDIVVVKRL